MSEAEAPDEQAIVDQLVGNSHGAFDVVRALLEEHPDLVERRSAWGESPLEAATQMGRKDIAALLMDKGAQPDFFAYCMLGDLERAGAELDAHPELATARGVHELAPLYFAAMGDNPEMVDLLLARGADVNAASGAGAPIHAAAMRGRSEIVKRLLEAGADPNARDYEGRTARQAAEAAHRPGIAQLFPET